MEVTQHLIMIGLLGAMIFASATADIIVQPGYGHKSIGGQVANQSGQVQGQNATPQQQQSTLAEEFERYKTLHRTIEEQLVHLIHEQNAQNLQHIAPGLVGLSPLFRPRVIHPLLPHIGGGRLFSLTPAGAHGLHLGGYGIRRHPLLLREKAADPFQQQEIDAARSQWTRSVTGELGLDGTVVPEVHDVSAQPTVDVDGVNGVVQLQVPEIHAADDSIVDKLVEPRQIGYRDDAIVGSPLDRIHYENPHDNKDQHHPIESSGMSSQVMKAVNAVGKTIDAFAPGIMNYENKDSASAMTRHQDPVPNYDHNSQYPQLSQQGQRTESPSIWNAPTTSSNNEPMTGQSYNSQQQSQNSKWSSIAPTQSSQSPKAFKKGFSQQAPAAFPATSNSMNNKNWLTTTHGHYPGYSSYQPDHQNHERPQTGVYRPYANGPSSYPSGTSSSATANANNPSSFGPGHAPYNYGSSYPSGPSSSATASANNHLGFGNGNSPYNYGSPYPNGASSSATASANNYPGFGNGPSPYNHGYPYANSATASANANAGNSGYNYPYRSSYNNAYVAYNPYATTNFVDQFGRSLFQGVPSMINSLRSNAGNYNSYLRNFVQNQLSGNYKQPGYSYSY